MFSGRAIMVNNKMIVSVGENGSLLPSPRRCHGVYSPRSSSLISHSRVWKSHSSSPDSHSGIVRFALVEEMRAPERLHQHRGQARRGRGARSGRNALCVRQHARRRGRDRRTRRARRVHHHRSEGSGRGDRLPGQAGAAHLGIRAGRLIPRSKCGAKLFDASGTPQARI